MQAPPSTILLVDDSPTNLQVLARTLQGSGHRILAARDGITALDIVRRAKPDLILLDVMMPGLDGFEVCRMIKSQPETADIAVIFLSARGEVADKVSGLELGAVDYVTKPIQADEVLARVATHLSRRQLERALRQSRDRLDHELASAARMQRLILPTSMPPGVAAFYQTSRYAGGDYYDIIELGGDRFAIMVADVSGHGAPAAIVMAMIRAALHMFPGVADDPVAVFHHINRHFKFLWETAMYATAVFAVIDTGHRTMRIASAGHPPPMVVQSTGSVSSIPLQTALCLLWDELGDVPCIELALQPGDRVVFFTDGITDRLSKDGAMFDAERLSASLARAGGRRPDEIVQSLLADVEAFADGQEPEDDQTLLVVAIE